MPFKIYSAISRSRHLILSCFGFDFNRFKNDFTIYPYWTNCKSNIHYERVLVEVSHAASLNHMLQR